MQNNKKSKKRSIDDLHDILDEASYKESPSDNKKYLIALDRRLKRSSYDTRVYSKLVAMQVGKEEVSLEPKVTIYLRGGGRRTEFPEVKKEDIIIKVEAVPTVLEEKPEKKPFEDEDIIEIEKIEYKEPQFIEIKPKVIVKDEETQVIEKKAIGDEELTEWEQIDQKDEEKPEWESLEEGVFITTEERPPKKPSQELPKQEEKFEIVTGFCGQCGVKLVAGDKFCPNCGINIEAGIEKEMIEEKQHEPVQKIKPETTFIPIEKVEEEESPEWEPATTRIKSVDEEPKKQKEFEDKYNKIEVFKEIKSINDDSAVLLFDKGFTSIDSIKDVTLGVLVDIVGIPKKLAKKIKKEIEKKFKESTFYKPVVVDAPTKEKDIDAMIKEDVLSKSIEEPSPVELQTKTSEWEPIEDIEKEEFEEQKFVKDPELDVFRDIKSIDNKTALILYNNGFTSIYSISMASIKDLAKIKG
ncbi:zinc ribbon domain-containing protein, partial [bacterium]|nr:zinc ribbon domain-containing protein [bacterium]